MGVRAFKYYVIASGGTPQPLVGTKTTGSTGPGSNVNLPVSDSSMFQKGDYAILDVGASEERCKVTAVPDGTHVTVDTIALAHGSGVYIRLAIDVNSVYVQTKDGNTGTVFLGTKSTMATSTGTFVIKELTKVTAGSQPTDYTSADLGGAYNPANLGDFWVDGTTNDNYLPSLTVV